MNEIFDKLMESGKKDAFSSAEKFYLPAESFICCLLMI